MLTYLFDSPSWPKANHQKMIPRGTDGRRNSPSLSAKLQNLSESRAATESTNDIEPSDLPTSLPPDDNYLQRTFCELQEFSPQALTLSDRFRQQTSKTGKFQLTSFAWNLHYNEDKIAECRCVRILGRGTDILNSWVFPTNALVLPVFASEVLEFGHQPRLVFIDLQAPGWNSQQKSQLAAELSELRDTNLLLPSTDTAPDWATQDGLGLHLHSRPGDPNFRPIIQELYSLYLKSWTDTTLRRLPVEAGSQVGREALSDYQHHHQESSPGNAYLNQLFGQEWTQDFYEQFLYAPVLSSHRGTTL